MKANEITQGPGLFKDGVVFFIYKPKVSTQYMVDSECLFRFII